MISPPLSFLPRPHLSGFRNGSNCIKPGFVAYYNNGTSPDSERAISLSGIARALVSLWLVYYTYSSSSWHLCVRQAFADGHTQKLAWRPPIEKPLIKLQMALLPFSFSAWLLSTHKPRHLRKRFPLFLRRAKGIVY